MPDEENTSRSVPVIEEQLVAGARDVKTGSVRVRKEVERTRKQIEAPVMRDDLKVTRVPVNRVVAAVPEMRQEGDTLIVPVVEEEIVIQRRFVLKEEIHIHRGRVKSVIRKTVEVGRERATVERLDADGNVVATSKPPRPAS